MVARLQSAPLTAVVADMDGTVLGCNSWPVFVRSLLRSLLRGGHWISAAALARKLMARRRGKITHREVKYAAARIARRHFPQRDMDRLLNRLEREVRPEVMSLLDSYPDSLRVLATAAAGEYAEALGRRLGFDRVLATMPADCPAAGYRELRGDLKAATVKQLLAEEGLRAAAVITDSFHDLPMLRAFPEADRVLVGPQAETLRALEADPSLASVRIVGEI